MDRQRVSRPDPRLCAIGGERFASPSGRYCYTDFDRGLEDAWVCAACLLAHVELHFGPEAPSARNLRALYGVEVPSCCKPKTRQAGSKTPGEFLTHAGQLSLFQEVA